MKFKNFLNNIIKKSDDIVVNMDGGVGGSWEIKEEDIECAVDETKVSCDTLGDVFYSPEAQGTWYTGVPAPAYCIEDPWFNAPVYSEKQMDYMEQETEMKRQERGENFSVEPDDIHQKMYEIATKNQSTTLHLNPPGGSENFHEGPGGWNSGTGINQFR